MTQPSTSEWGGALNQFPSFCSHAPRKKYLKKKSKEKQSTIQVEMILQEQSLT